ncbi:YciI family protein [Jatrophihabitans lederbergiae]|uniref:YciI family protein n=1 Tax=Jatrophihabitans lederbergiae TaxID=3075547 RepID=A0ABU2J7L7_9ACTN|nr:YciI family protein [Jatrophihabitans sp. DSM 44399]MDT0260619.1 YciI family protein [Jatrophihabitans sp. DSM 44399]
MRVLMYTLGDESTPMAPPTPEMMTQMDQLVSDATKAGAMLATGGLAPTAQGTKVSYSQGEFSVVDGPFTETKELVGGWALMEVRDKEEAIEWAKRFLAVAGDGESTIRQVFGPDDLPPGFDPTAL